MNKIINSLKTSKIGIAMLGLFALGLGVVGAIPANAQITSASATLETLGGDVVTQGTSFMQIVITQYMPYALAIVVLVSFVGLIFYGVRRLFKGR
jgi:hypothetical protein